jgi:hypothetical protein
LLDIVGQVLLDITIVSSQHTLGDSQHFGSTRIYKVSSISLGF